MLKWDPKIGKWDSTELWRFFGTGFPWQCDHGELSRQEAPCRPSPTSSPCPASLGQPRDVAILMSLNNLRCCTWLSVGPGVPWQSSDLHYSRAHQLLCGCDDFWRDLISLGTAAAILMHGLVQFSGKYSENYNSGRSQPWCSSNHSLHW